MCGGKKIFRIGLEKLKDRCGSKSTMREFRRLVKAIAEDDIVHNHFPDYSLRLLDGDMVEFSNRRAAIAVEAPVELPVEIFALPLKPETFDVAISEAYTSELQ